MARIDLTVVPWTDDHQTRESEECQSLLASSLSVDGTPIVKFSDRDALHVTLSGLGGDFLSLTIKDPPDALRERFADPATYLLGTNEEQLLLPVSELYVSMGGTLE